jgi:hypothetical protein
LQNKGITRLQGTQARFAFTPTDQVSMAIQAPQRTLHSYHKRDISSHLTLLTPDTKYSQVQNSHKNFAHKYRQLRTTPQDDVGETNVFINLDLVVGDPLEPQPDEI